MRAQTLKALAGGACVVTPTARLAREIRRQFDRARQDLGMRAWESADVLPFDAFAQRLWRAHRRPELLLNEWQLRAAWESIIRGDIQHRDVAPLWNTHATAQLAAGAWRLAREWRISPQDCAASAHEDHRRWARWAQRYQKRCAERNWTDAHCIAGKLAAMPHRGGAPPHAGKVPGKIIAAGFDRLLPQQKALLDALRNGGCEVEVEAPRQKNSGGGAPEMRACKNPADEWLQAARWARDKLRASPHARIAIVAPNLERAGRAIEYACRQILRPREMLAPGLRADLPYNIALGGALGEYPVARAALDALAPFSGAPLPAETLSRLLRSPFLCGAESEAAARGRRERWCRRNLPYQVRFQTLLREIAKENPRAPSCPVLRKALGEAAPLLRHIKEKRPPGFWAQAFTDWLRHLGWPGERALDSDEYQTARATRRELRNLASLEATAAPMRAPDALAWLQRRLAEQMFQVEVHDTSVQVLSVREAAGQRFDALWFGGLVEADWPPPRSPNPFIAARLQQRAGVPGASVDGAREYALQQQRRLLASADEAVFSYPKTEDDIPAEPSALPGIDIGIGKFFAATSGDEDKDEDARAPCDTPAEIFYAHKPELQTFTDARAPALAPGGAPGGVAVIEHQAQCPFRAFATHRLGATDATDNEQGLAPYQRGSLLHRALQLLWEKIETSENLHALSPEQLREAVDGAVAKVCNNPRFTGGCGARFLEAQAKWAGDTLQEWLENEKRRAVAFRAHQLEQTAKLQLGELELTMQIDRIDKLEDGALALIDYKTGGGAGAGDWGGARPRSPQLPLYALAQNNAPLAALAYGRVRRGECAFRGVARDAGFIESGGAQANLPPPEKHRALNHFADWDEMLAHWRAELPELAREFLGGDARVAPLRGACDHCGLHGLCRVDAGEF
ncbi:MAG: PD-(D/E)XK nuclease family protein [Gammaproteobacteria bacterium]|nr:PD-(D/E)XK nuclease family protein [Gammaproteobacteria bacterium]